MPETYFAPAAKADKFTLQADINLISNHPIIDALLHSASGFLAILNEQRQILSANDSFLKSLGIQDPNELLSLRPGQAVQCIHAYEFPNGYGTTKFCASCGAAIAMVSCLDKNIPVEKTCALTANRNGKIVEIALAVRAQHLTIEGMRFIMFLRRISAKNNFSYRLNAPFSTISTIFCAA